MLQQILKFRTQHSRCVAATMPALWPAIPRTSRQHRSAQWKRLIYVPEGTTKIESFFVPNKYGTKYSYLRLRRSRARHSANLVFGRALQQKKRIGLFLRSACAIFVIDIF
ncbi:MAG TPA: hypothetical protein DEB64_06015 [Alistipes sp.]|nr:hypothetical protein [Alistipes sp.]